MYSTSNLVYKNQNLYIVPEKTKHPGGPGRADSRAEAAGKSWREKLVPNAVKSDGLEDLDL